MALICYPRGKQGPHHILIHYLRCHGLVAVLMAMITILGLCWPVARQTCFFVVVSSLPYFPAAWAINMLLGDLPDPNEQPMSRARHVVSLGSRFAFDTLAPAEIANLYSAPVRPLVQKLDQAQESLPKIQVHERRLQVNPRGMINRSLLKILAFAGRPVTEDSVRVSSV